MLFYLMVSHVMRDETGRMSKDAVLIFGIMSIFSGGDSRKITQNFSEYVTCQRMLTILFSARKLDHELSTECYHKWALSFSWSWLWKVLSSGKWRHAVHWHFEAYMLPPFSGWKKGIGKHMSSSMLIRNNDKLLPHTAWSHIPEYSKSSYCNCRVCDFPQSPEVNNRDIPVPQILTHAFYLIVH
jgi:hypothetical protein